MISLLRMPRMLSGMKTTVKVIRMASERKVCAPISPYARERINSVAQVKGRIQATL